MFGKYKWYIVSLLVIMKELFLYPLQISHEGVWYSYTMAVGSFYWAYLNWNNTLDLSSCLRMSVFHSVYLWVWISHVAEPLMLSTQVINRLLVRSFLEESMICIKRVVKASLLNLLYDAVCWVYSSSSGCLCQNPSYVRFICKETYA